MQNMLKQRLASYIASECPVLLGDLGPAANTEKFLQLKVRMVLPLVIGLLDNDTAVETAELRAYEKMVFLLRPERYLYLRDLLRSVFPETFAELSAIGVLAFELAGLMEACSDLFEVFDYDGIAGPDNMRQAMIDKLHGHLE